MLAKSFFQLCVKLTIALLLSSPINLLAAATATTTPSPMGSIFKVLLGLTVVLLVMAAITWVLKRMMPGAGGQHSVIKVVGGVSVGTRERLVVVEVAGRWLVVGVAAGQVNAIANLDKESNMLGDSLQNTQPPIEANMHGLNMDSLTGALAPKFSQWLKNSKGKMLDHSNAK